MNRKASKKDTEGQSSNLDAKRPTSNTIYRPLLIRIMNKVGGTLRSMGMRSPRLDFKSLSKEAGFEPTKEDQAFLSRFKTLIMEADECPEINYFGRRMLQGMFVGILHNRVQIRQWISNHPETLQVPVEHPLFVTGQPRTGTTLLYNLLAQDPDSHTPLAWEITKPYPPLPPSSVMIEQRIRETKRLLDFWKWYNPSNYVAHPTEPCSPEECHNLMMNSAFSTFFRGMFDCPLYLKKIINSTLEEQIDAYADYYNQIQILQFYNQNRRWVSKCPTHIDFLEPLLITFPDAHVVFTHRDPMEQIPSFCKLFVLIRSMVTDQIEDFQTIGDMVLEWWQEAYLKTENARDSYGQRIIDITYSALMKDPVGEVKKIYAKVDYPFTPVFEERMRAWLAENPQNKHGVHHYHLEQFGLDRERVEAATRDYRQRYLAN